MRRRILFAILSVTAMAIVLFAVPLAIVVERFVDEDATLRVERQAILATRSVPGDFAATADPVEMPAGTDGVTLALYAPAGELVAGLGPPIADRTTRRALRNQVADTEVAGTRIVAVPVVAEEQVVGAIRAEQSTAATNARTWRIIGLVALLAVVVVAVGAAIGYVVADRLARPVRVLRDAAVRLGEGDFTIDVPRNDVPELDQAAQAVTATARRLDDLVTRERSFSEDASHQLRTPLAGLRTALETELQFPRADPAELLHEALADVDRLERTVTELLSIARSPHTTHEPIELSGVLDRLNGTWRGSFAAVGRPLRVSDVHEGLLVRANPAMLANALDALLDNALHHGDGEVRIDTFPDDDAITISITDDGPGFDDTPLDDLHGLGLPLARRLVEAMPGRLTIAHRGPRPRVELVLERADRDQVPAPERA